MKVTVITASGTRHPAEVADSQEFVTISRCPACRTEQAQIRGTGIDRHNHDTYYGPAVAQCCGIEVRMETKVSTIFGIEEDNAVLNGRARVY